MNRIGQRWVFQICVLLVFGCLRGYSTAELGLLLLIVPVVNTALIEAIARIIDWYILRVAKAQWGDK